ncbi:unnamed protein product [Linum trigynum]|uniref:Uncharacterized protein n=1 Tax=Linum trigynum TaxID=586398 RepID=A0AAV2E1D6_9ROSI
MYEHEPYQQFEGMELDGVKIDELSSSDSEEEVLETLSSDEDGNEDTSNGDGDDTMILYSDVAIESEDTFDSNGDMVPGTKKRTKARLVTGPARVTRSRATTAQSEYTVQDRTSEEEDCFVEDEAASNAAEGGKKNQRAKTKGYEVKKSLEEGSKIGGIVIEEGAKAVVGINDKLWKMKIGVIVRVLAPIGKFYWRELTEEDKLPLFAKLESEFDIDMTTPGVKEMVDATMASRLRQFKYRCHQRYKNEIDKVKARETPMEEVNINDWELLCDHFDILCIKKQSDANTANRSQQLYSHTAGAKSVSQRIYELNQKEANSEKNK